jgi:hypothetical protein
VPLVAPYETVDVGWTPEGNVMRLEGDTVSVCSPMVEADCSSTTFSREGGTVRMGGEPYGS